MSSAWQRATTTTSTTAARVGGTRDREAWAQLSNAVQQSWCQERTIVSLMAIAMLASKLCPAETRSHLARLVCDNLDECRDSLFMATVLHMLHAAFASSSSANDDSQNETLGLVFDKIMTLGLQGGEPAISHLQVHVARLAAHHLVGL